MYTYVSFWHNENLPNTYLHVYTDTPNTQTHTHTHNRLLLDHKGKQNNDICSNIDRLRDYHSKWIKSEKEKCHITCVWKLKKNVTNELIHNGLLRQKTN